ncbi:SITS-binding protein-like [Aegotheles albertisi]
MPLARPSAPIPEAAWTSGFREMTEPWKGAVGCLGVAVFFAMTIGIISWQALEQPPEEWVLRGRAGGVLWERRRGALLLRALPEGRTAAVVAVGGSVPATEPPPPRDRCWHDGRQFCYAWEEDAELRLSLEPPPAPATECYSVRWTPLRPDVRLKDCFSMANVSWYGGASTRAQRWPLNGAESPAQPFVSSDFSKKPAGYGPVLERYFLGSTGVTVTVAPAVPLLLSLESNKHFCLGTPAGGAAVPLRYQLCISPDVAAAHRHVGSQLGGQERALPDTALLGLPIWRYHGPEGSAAKIRRGLRSWAKRLKRHHRGSLAGDSPGDPELYVRWLQIMTFLPVMAFSTPPWLCCDTWVLNLTRRCIQRHRDFVVPLLMKYSEEWLSLGYPIFRPAWWLSPTDPTAFTIEDEFLIGDEVLVAPITEKGQTWRDIFLPGEGQRWLDTNTARVFDGGTTLTNYSAGLTEVPVFVKTS